MCWVEITIQTREWGHLEPNGPGIESLVYYWWSWCLWQLTLFLWTSVFPSVNVRGSLWAWSTWSPWLSPVLAVWALNCVSSDQQTVLCQSETCITKNISYPALPGQAYPSKEFLILHGLSFSWHLPWFLPHQTEEWHKPFAPSRVTSGHWFLPVCVVLTRLLCITIFFRR